MTFLSIPAHPPFNFYNTVRSHGWYQLAPYEWDDAKHILRKTERLSDERVVSLRFSDADTGAGVAVEVTGRLTKAELAEISAKTRWIFALDADLSAFYDQVEREPRLRHCRKHAYGRLLRSSSMWEDVVKVMMTTNIQWSGTKRLVKALVDHFGEPLVDDSSRRAFPTAKKIARSRETTLRKLGLGYRAPYVLKLARGLVKGEYDLDALKDPTLPTDELRKRLIALPGIGPYAANTLLMILERYDHIGVDTEAMSAVSTHFYDGQSVGEKEINAAFAAWGRFKALAYWFWDYDGTHQAPMDQYDARTEK